MSRVSKRAQRLQPTFAPSPAAPRNAKKSEPLASLAICIEIKESLSKSSTVRPLSRRFECAADGPNARRKLLEQMPFGLITSRLGGLSHARRLRILLALSEGTTSHAELVRRVRLKPGPLYFHLRRMQSAGLIRSPGRSHYELTEDGLAFALVVVAGLRGSMARKP